jgi:hypothetical protein
MVGRESFQARDGTVSHRRQGVARGLHIFARAVEIDIGLRAIFRPNTKEPALCDALERDEVQGQSRQLPVGFFEDAQAQQIVGGVTLGRRRQEIADHECQTGVMAKIQGGEPGVFIETCQYFRTRLGEV